MWSLLCTCAPVALSSLHLLWPCTPLHSIALACGAAQPCTRSIVLTCSLAQGLAQLCAHAALHSSTLVPSHSCAHPIPSPAVHTCTSTPHRAHTRGCAQPCTPNTERAARLQEEGKPSSCGRPGASPSSLRGATSSVPPPFPSLRPRGRSALPGPPRPARTAAARSGAGSTGRALRHGAAPAPFFAFPTCSSFVSPRRSPALGKVTGRGRPWGCASAPAPLRFLRSRRERPFGSPGGKCRAEGRRSSGYGAGRRGLGALRSHGGTRRSSARPRGAARARMRGRRRAAGLRCGDGGTAGWVRCPSAPSPSRPWGGCSALPLLPPSSGHRGHPQGRSSSRAPWG